MARRDDPKKMERMHAWVAAVEEELGIESEVMEEAKGALLALIGKVAHGPSRPGAPLTAFLIGLAVGRGKGESLDLIAQVKDLVTRYEEENPSEDDE